MSVEFKCGDPARLAGYLYDECEPAERTAVERHLASCAACADELRELGATRTALASWIPPDAKLGFKVTSADDDLAASAAGARVLRPARWWQRPLPAWAQAAAALLIFAVGAGLGMRLGPNAAAPEAAPSAVSAPVETAVDATPAAASVTANDLAALERRLRAEMSAMRTSSSAPATAAQPSPASDAVLQRVRTMLAESEARQQRELALRLTQVLRDVDAQRRTDLARIEQTFGQMEGVTQPELADQRQMLNYLIQRTGLQRSPR